MADQKPKGYYNRVLVADCETSGFFSGQDDPSYNPKTKQEYQAVAWGLIVADADTLQPIDKLYLEIQWNGVSLWDPGAQAIHGLSKQHLQQHGVSEETAVIEIGNLVLKHWGPGVSGINFLGHNVVSFDLPFFKRLMRKFGIELKYSHRHIDTNAIGFATIGTYNSDDLFEAVGMEVRGHHNALTDAKYALEVVRRVRTLWKNFVEE